MPRTAAKRERLEDRRGGGRSEGRQSEKYQQQTEVKLVTHLSQLIRNRTETTPSQETTHISRSEIFLYQVNQVYKIMSNK